MTKNEIIDELIRLNNKAIFENRSFTDEEEDYYADLERELKKIEKAEIRKNCIVISDFDIKRKDDVKMEKRELTNFLTNKNEDILTSDVETRATGVTLKSANTGIVPQHVAGEIVRKLTEYAPLFAMAKTFVVSDGELNVPQEDADNLFDVSFVGENGELDVNAIKFNTVKLTAKRCGAGVEVTQQLVQDSGIDIQGYVADLCARNLARGLNKAVLLGDGVNSFQGVLTVEGVVTDTTTALTADDLIKLTRMMNPEYVKGSVLVMNREMFVKISQMTDGGGQFLMILDFRHESAVYSIGGVEVVIDDNMSDDKILMINPLHALGSLVRNNVVLKKVDGDRNAVLKGLVLFVVEMYADVKVINKDAIRMLKIQAEE
ncbi:phage major capsid protein [Turicibacter sanguinis]|jgi:phage capsid family|uniref:phage major capsid protein n=1 Tax=Turicibacter sanguinis TaxID=154288 RepID=UPI00325C2075